MGAAMLAGGLRFRSQQYNVTAARSQATMLLIAAILLVAAGAFRDVVQADAPELIGFSLAIAAVLLVVYVCNLVFSLVTHRGLFEGSGDAPAPGEHEAPVWSARKGLIVLVLATVAVAWMSEILVAAIEPAAKALGFGSLFCRGIRRRHNRQCCRAQHRDFRRLAESHGSVAGDCHRLERSDRLVRGAGARPG
jgi:Ca2+:H+ antiporter